MYTHSYIHVRILIHILIHVYSFIYLCTYTRSYTHSCMLIHVYSFIYSGFSSLTFSTSHSCFMNVSIHFAFPILFLFYAYYIWHSIYLYSMMLMYSHIIRVFFLSLNESILLRNWNHSNWIIQTKVMAFSCQTSQFTDITLGTVCITHFSVS